MPLIILADHDWEWLKEILTRIDETMKQILEQEKAIMQEIDDLVAQVTAVKGVEDSAVELINRIVTMLQEAAAKATDLDTLKAAVNEQVQVLRDNTAPLAAAVAANPGP
jgi:chromosome segregation ATPase